MTPVALKGRDADLAVDKGTRQITVSHILQGVRLTGQIGQQQLQGTTNTRPAAEPGAGIDCAGDRHTYRRVEIRNLNLNQRFFWLHVDFINFSTYNLPSGGMNIRSEWRPEQSMFPQRHIVDAVFYGANGIQGFMPYNIWWPYSTDPAALRGRFSGTNNIVAMSFSQILNIRSRWPGGGEGSAIRGWQISEDTGWARDDDRDSVADFSFTDQAQMYTRSANLQACLAAGATSRRQLEVAQALNLFYSRHGVFTLRLVFDIRTNERNQYRQFLRIEKYSGTESVT